MGRSVDHIRVRSAACLKPTAESIREMTASIDKLCADGFLVVRGAVAPDVVRMCVDVIERELRARVIDPHDPATWTEPVIRFLCPEGSAFAAASASPALRNTYDARGTTPRTGGTVS